MSTSVSVFAKCACAAAAFGRVRAVIEHIVQLAVVEQGGAAQGVLAQLQALRQLPERPRHEGGAAAQAADEEIAGVKFSGQVLDGLDPKELRGLLDQAKQRLGSGVAVIVAVNEGKASIAAAVTDDLTGQVSAVDLVRAGVEALGGKGGGGRPDMAQGGGPDGDKADAAIAAAKGVLAG